MHAEHLNDIIARHNRAAAACLSPVGRRLFFPKGIPAQSADAHACHINATIGQVTDGTGHSLPLPAVLDALASLEADDATLYSAQGGRRDLRQRWAAHIAGDAPDGAVPATLPVATCGLTHGIAMVADLFVGPGTPVLLPDPAWGNYRAIFGVARGAALRTWQLLRPDAGPDDPALDLDDLRRALAALPGPGVLLLNFPSNPTGYAPTPEEVDELVDILRTAVHPLVVICDDAYHGMWWTPQGYHHSLFHRLSTCAPGRVLAVKVDGATKELLYFGGRVGFVTIGDGGPAGEALEDKLRASARASISTASSTSQAVLLRALQHPDLPQQQAWIRERLRRRYQALRDALDAEGLQAWPFNAGMFALIKVRRDPEEIRQALLSEGVGVINIGGAVRLSFGSVRRADIPALVASLARHAR